MKQFQLNKLKQKKQESMGYLRAIEKSIMKNKKIRTLEEKGVFRSYIKTHHTEDEIDMMINDLELNLNRLNEYNKLIISLAVPFLIVLFSFISANILFIFKTDFNLAVVAFEANKFYKQLNYNEFIRYFGIIWTIAYISIFILAYLGISLLPRRQIMYLSILKTVK